MPPELQEASRRSSRRFWIFANGFVGGAVWFLMWRASLPPSDAGLQAARWVELTGLGLVGALAFICPATVMHILVRRVTRKTMALRPDWRPPARRPPGQQSYGSQTFWVLSAVVESFAQEFWRAFCLVAFERLGHSAAFGVALTTAVYTVAYVEPSEESQWFRRGRFVSLVMQGVIGSLLFIWSGSVMPAFISHLALNLTILWRDRHHGEAGLLPAAPPLCPKCATRITFNEVRRVRFACPNCGTWLRVKSTGSAGIAVIMGVALGFLVPYLLSFAGHHVYWLAPIIFLVVFFGGTFLAALVTVPKLEVSLPDRTPVHGVLGLSDPPDSKPKG